MIPVIAKNKFSYEDFTIAVKLVLVYKCKNIFRYVAVHESGLFYRCKVSRTLVARDIKICSGFSVGALKNAAKIWQFLCLQTPCRALAISIFTSYSTSVKFFFIEV